MVSVSGPLALSWHIPVLVPSGWTHCHRCITAVAPINVPLSSTTAIIAHVLVNFTTFYLPTEGYERRRRGERGEGGGVGQGKNNSSLSRKCNKDIIDFPTFLCFPLF